MIGFIIAAALAAAPAGTVRTSQALEAGLAAYTRGEFTTARGCFSGLAGEGSAIAETMLGTMTAHGQGTVRDPAAAAGFYFRAAYRGYPPAQLAFARALLRGDGVATDRAVAVIWLRLAAQRGDSKVAAAARAEAATLGVAPPLPAVDDWQPWPSGGD